MTNCQSKSLLNWAAYKALLCCVAVSCIVLFTTFATPVSADTVPVTASLELQLDAMDINADGLPDSLANNSIVTQWKDNAQSNDASSSGDPRYIVQGIQHQDGTWKPVVQFDGVGDYFQMADSTKLDFTTESLSIFLVANCLSPSDYYFSKKSAASTGYKLTMWTGHEGLRYQAVGDTSYDDLPHALSQHSLMEVIHDRTANTHTLYDNGTLLAASPHAVADLGNMSDTGIFTLGANCGSLGPDPGIMHLVGDIAELLIYSSALDDTDRGKVEDYLTQKWLVPEPSTFVLLAMAMLGGILAWWRRRKLN